MGMAVTISAPSRSLLAVLLMLILGVLAGCEGKPQPPMVVGRVVFKDVPTHIRRLEGGKVWIQSASDSSLMGVGVIDDEGNFALGLYSPEPPPKELPAGEYKLRVEPPLDENQEPQKGILHTKYQNFTQSGFTLTAPVTGEVLLEVERPRR
jgi:hypothetical protein